MKSSDIRNAFVNYFKKNGHTAVASSSFIPEKDPTLLFANTAELKAAAGTRRTYGRHGSATTMALEQALCALEGADDCLLTPSGLSAISTTLLALLQPGDDLLMSDACYEPTRALCDGLLARLDAAWRQLSDFTADAAHELNIGFVSRMTRGRPWVRRRSCPRLRRRRPRSRRTGRRTRARCCGLPRLPPGHHGRIPGK